MNRIPESELMNDDEQAAAYAQADFSGPHSRVITLFKETFGTDGIKGYVLDLGCGSGDIAFRFARAYPDSIVHGIDGAEAMLRYGMELLQEASDIRGRVELIHGFLPDAAPPLAKYDIIISNSLLHHLMDSSVLWQAVRRYAAPGAPVFIVDLKRPGSPEEAHMLVETYCGSEPEILKRDFYNSLLAAFDVDEVKAHLKEENLDYLDVKEISDRHLLISGYFIVA
jgi:SAM-dependent methyltransferase